MTHLSSVTDIMEKAKHGEDLTVVFLGGSLTWGANASDPNRTSWRARTMEMLCRKYPLAHWNFVDSAIGGTGSMLGVFRLEHDVFRYQADLVILDFTLNDGLSGTREGLHDISNQSYETVLRECLSRRIAVLPTFLAGKVHVQSEDLSVWARRLEHMELCRKYHLAFADVLGKMNREFHAGKLCLEDLWPEELFDETHPHDAGYGVFAEKFSEEWDRIGESFHDLPVLPETYVTGSSFAHFTRIDLSQHIPEGWVKSYPWVVSDSYDWMTSRWVDRLVTLANAELQPGLKWICCSNMSLKEFSFSFRAEWIGLFMEALPESVGFSVSIDGEEPRNIPFRAVKRSQCHMVTLGSGLDPEKVHTLTVCPQIPPMGDPGVMRWGSLLLHSSQDVSLVWE